MTGNRPTHYGPRNCEHDPDTPGREGSREACNVLLLLHKHAHTGLSFGDLQVFLGLDRPSLSAALGGLQDRYRVACVGRGTAARWMLTQHAPAGHA